MISTRDCEGLCQAVEALGGTTPPEVTVALDSVQAFYKVAAQHAGGSFTATTLTQTIQGAVAAGEPLSFEVAWAAAKKAAVTQLMRTEVGQNLGRLDYDTALLIQSMLRGNAGDAMFKSLQPTVDTAIKGIEAAAAHYGPEDTLEQVVDRGDEAVAAWRSAQAHEATLDRVLNTVVRNSRFVDLIEPALLTDLGAYWMAAFFMPWPARAIGDYTPYDALVKIGTELDRSGVVWKVPGGRWLEIHRLCGLRLNSPAEAAELLASLQKDMHDQLQSHTPRQQNVRESTGDSVNGHPGLARAEGADTEELPVPGGIDIGYSEDTSTPLSGR